MYMYNKTMLYTSIYKIHTTLKTNSRKTRYEIHIYIIIL